MFRRNYMEAGYGSYAMYDDITPTPVGLMRCLQVLTEEADCLGLVHTSAALHDAIETCRVESARNLAHVSLRLERALRH